MVAAAMNGVFPGVPVASGVDGTGTIASITEVDSTELNETYWRVNRAINADPCDGNCYERKSR